MNETLKFHGVTEMTFPSIMRRNCKGRFVSAQRLARNGHPGALSHAGGQERFRDLRRTWPSTRTAPVTGSLLGQARAWWRPWRRGMYLVGCWATKRGLSVKHCLERGWDFCSEYHVSTLHQDVWPRVPARDRVGTLRQLKARGWWKELPPRGRSGAPLIPRITMERGVLDLFPPVPDGAEPVAHRETLSADPCVSSCECVALVRHLVKLQVACDAKANHPPCATRSRLSKRTTWPTSSNRRVGRRSRASCVTSIRSASLVAGIRHRSGHSAAATWFGPMCCLMLQRVSTW